MSFFSTRTIGVVSAILLAACTHDQVVAPESQSNSNDDPQAEAGVASVSPMTFQLVKLDTVVINSSSSRSGGRLSSWRTTNPSVAIVTSKREVIALAPGVADIIEKNAGLTVTTTVRVAAGLAVLEPTPTSVSMRVGEARRVGVSVRTSDSKLLTSQTVRYVVADTSLASVNATGDVYGRRAGTTTVRAIRGESFITVPVTIAPAAGVDPTNPPPPSPIVTTFTIAPKTVTVPAGTSLQFSAVARAADGTAVGSSVTYVAAGGTITMSGLFTAGQAAGVYMIVATCACGKADTAYANVAASSSPPPTSTMTAVTIAPRTTLIAPNASAQFSAGARWSNGDSTSATVVYSATGGTVSPTGSYSAPSTPGTYFVVARQEGGTLADTATVTVETPIPPAEGVLYSHGFDDGLMGSIWKWGGARVITDPTATGGRSVQVDWLARASGDSDQGLGYSISAPAKKIHIRFRYKQDALANNGGIKKTVRFRGDNNKALGTFNIQWGGWLFYGDDYTMAPWNIWQTGRGTSDPVFVNNTPDTFRNRWRYVEMMLDYSVEGRQRAAMWVDGTQIINYDAPLQWTLPANFSLKQVWMASVYNEPVLTQTDWFDSVVISTSYIGTP